MADSAVAVTAGTGTNIDTRTEGTNGHHRQVVVIGDPATNAGVAPVDATNGLAVDVKASALPTGAGTSAKQDTIIGHLDGVEGLLTTIDADTGNVSTKIDTIAGAVAGTEVQVDVVGALPAGSNAIGKLAANSGVDIGDTDVTSVIPGTGATNLGKAIDTATGATDTGVLALATRDDALSALTPIEGDNVQLRTTSTGALWVTQSGTVTVDGSGVTQPVSNAGLTELAAAINSSKVDVNIVSSDVATGGTSALDDADFTAGTTPGTPAMGVYESTPTSVTDGDLGTVGITAGRRMKTSATIDAALPAGTNNIGDVDVLSSALPTGASTSANQTTIIGHLDGVEGLLTTIDGDTGNISTKIDTIAGAVSGTEMQVDVLTLPNVTNAGTFAVQVDGAALTALQLIDDTIATLGTTTYTEAATKGSIIGAVRRDADTTLVDTTNEIGPLQMNAAGQLKVEVFSGEALPVTMTSTTVTGTVAVTQSGTWDEVGINDSGNSITVDYATTGSGTATGALRVELPTNGTGTVGLNAGTNNIGDVDILSIAAGDNNIGNVDIVSGTVTTVTTLTGGGIAHDSADSGNPHKMGAKAYSPDGTTPGTAVAEADRTDLKADLDGRLFVNPRSPRQLHKHLDGSSAYTDEAVAADPGDGFQIVITSIIVSTGAATALNFFLEEGATKIFGPIYLEATAGRGFVSGPIYLPVTASTAVTITTSAAIAQSVDIDYFIQAV